MQKINSAVLILLISFFGNNLVHGQKDALNIFKPITGIDWSGHYVGSRDSTLVHHIKWEYSVDSSYVKQTKEVPELSFKMETYFYWDFEKKQISSITFIRGKMASKGKIQFNNERIEVYSGSFDKKGYNNSKQTFELTKSGDLKDYYYRKKEGEWSQGHLIRYKKL